MLNLSGFIRVELGVVSIVIVAQNLVATERRVNIFLWSEGSAKSSQDTDSKDTAIRVRKSSLNKRGYYIRNHPIQTKILLNQLVASLQTAEFWMCPLSTRTRAQIHMARRNK